MTGNASWASTPATRKSMLANRGRDTGPELAVRRLVHARGLRYLVDTRPEPTLRRRADLVFRGPRVAVFVDGCFWHGCRQHYTRPTNNADFWADKVATNRTRDLETTRTLAERGWTVLRFWEHERPEDVAARIEEAVHAARRTP